MEQPSRIKIENVDTEEFQKADNFENFKIEEETDDHFSGDGGLEFSSNDSLLDHTIPSESCTNENKLNRHVSLKQKIVDENNHKKKGGKKKRGKKGKKKSSKKASKIEICLFCGKRVMTRNYEKHLQSHFSQPSNENEKLFNARENIQSEVDIRDLLNIQ